MATLAKWAASAGISALGVLVGTALSPASADNIGTAIVVVKTVTGTLANISRQLNINDNVEQAETIATAPDAATEIQFVDGTKLQLGPNAKIVLDKFVYDPNPGKGALALSLSAGVMRFTTGNMAHQNYTINTPNGTLGVRGTDLDIGIDNGETVVQVNDGIVVGTSTNGVTQTYTKGGCFAMFGSTFACSVGELNYITTQATRLSTLIVAAATGTTSNPPHPPSGNTAPLPVSPPSPQQQSPQ